MRRPPGACLLTADRAGGSGDPRLGAEKEIRIAVPGLAGGNRHRLADRAAALLWQRPSVRDARRDPAISLPVRLVCGGSGLARRSSPGSNTVFAVARVHDHVVRAQSEPSRVLPRTDLLFNPDPRRWESGAARGDAS